MVGRRSLALRCCLSIVVWVSFSERVDGRGSKWEEKVMREGMVGWGSVRALHCTDVEKGVERGEGDGRDGEDEGSERVLVRRERRRNRRYENRRGGVGRVRRGRRSSLGGRV